jgi:hypothetical protein
MLIIGGGVEGSEYFFNNDVPATRAPQGTECAKGGMEISAFGLSTLKFAGENFDPGLGKYDVPDVIIKQISGKYEHNGLVSLIQQGNFLTDI